MKIDQTILNVIKESAYIFVLTGAGASAESGIPTYRDAMQGIWAKYDFMELASPEGFMRDPAKVTEWYDMRRLMMMDCEPNRTHTALAEFEDWCEDQNKQFLLVTQNVDGLHQRAGSRNVTEMHGSLLRWRNTQTGEEKVVDSPEPFDSYPPIENDAKLRPSVVWFGEMLDPQIMEKGYAALEACDLFISIGTSANVAPASQMLAMAKAGGAQTMEFNLEATSNSSIADYCVQGKSGEIMDELIAKL